mmetsp:Transcript_86767/g.221057  ORF Transcript_86767/g.221057 Transcript_86767/m.221057 type:complete len:212 (-) Transcript_86767:387-1022(-)
MPARVSSVEVFLVCGRAMCGAAGSHPMHGRVREGLCLEVRASPLLGVLKPPTLVAVLLPVPGIGLGLGSPVAPGLDPEALDVLVARRLLDPPVGGATPADVVANHAETEAGHTRLATLVGQLAPRDIGGAGEEEVCVRRSLGRVRIQCVGPPAERAAEPLPVQVPGQGADPGVDLEAPPMMGSTLLVPRCHRCPVVLVLAQDVGTLSAVSE